VPKSRIRRKSAYTPPPSKTPTKLSAQRRNWIPILMVAFFIIGLLWIVTFYVSGTQLPIKAMGPWNIAVGFGFIAVGFGLATQWK
jgi:hypothetical protein